MAHVSAMVADSSGMKNKALVVSTTLLLMACGNKSREVKPVLYEGDTIVEQVVDTMPATVQETMPKAEEKPSTSAVSASSSSRSHHSGNYDNMRGFDPASEDDMDDNGMSRYMENNDEEGWE